MTLQEKTLYHQIHPLKLATDISTAVVSCALLWIHRAPTALVVGLIPSILISLLLIGFADLASLKHSRFGDYVRKHMTRKVEVLRLLGMGIVWHGAWSHWSWEIATGLLVIGAAWTWPLSRYARSAKLSGLYRERSDRGAII